MMGMRKYCLYYLIDGQGQALLSPVTPSTRFRQRRWYNVRIVQNRQVVDVFAIRVMETMSCKYHARRNLELIDGQLRDNFTRRPRDDQRPTTLLAVALARNGPSFFFVYKPCT